MTSDPRCWPGSEARLRRRSLSDEKLGTVSRLTGCGRDCATRWDALVRGERDALLDIVHEQVKGTLRMRLDEFELRKDILVGFDMVAVLHLVETVRREIPARINPVVAALRRRGRNRARI